MDVLVVADGHYFRTPDGTVYADSVYDYNFYKRYLQAFDHVYAVVRAIDVSEAPKGKRKSSGEGVSFLFLPHYQGPVEYIKKYFQVLRCVKKFCDNYPCAIFRIPAATSNIFCQVFSKSKKPFAVEVVVDPWENFGPRATGNKLMLWIVRRSWTRLVKNMCSKAIGASYVTQNYLQKLYPPKAYSSDSEDAFTASYSSVELADHSFGKVKNWNTRQDKFVISHVSNYFSGYGKGHLTLMKALKIVREHGYNVSIQFVGDGPKKAEFMEFASELGIQDSVVFLGRLANGDEVRKTIKSSDIFILPTFAEGLPRVLLEAMAEGLPCLSSPVCGIPEILDKEFLFDFDDAEGFARGIERFVTNTQMMNEQSARNLEVAKGFSSTVLNERRKDFYTKLRLKAERIKE